MPAPNSRGISPASSGADPAPVVALEGAVDLPRSHVLDHPAADLEALAGQPSGGRGGEVADHLGDVHRVGRVERRDSSARARSIRQPMVARRVAADGMIAFAVTPYGAISVAIASVNASTPALAAT